MLVRSAMLYPLILHFKMVLFNRAPLHSEHGPIVI